MQATFSPSIAALLAPAIVAALVVPRICYAAPEAAKPAKHPLSAADASARSSAEVVPLRTLLSELDAANPEILAAQHRFQAAAARPSQERALPDPMVGLAATNMQKALPFTTVGDDPQSNAAFSFSQEVPFPGKLSLKGQVADKEAESQEQDLRSVRLAVRTKLRSAYYEWSSLRQQLKILEETRGVLDSLAAIARSQYEVGKGNQQDVLRAEVESAILQTRLIQQWQQEASVRAKLNALLNRAPDAPLGSPELLKKGALAGTIENLQERAQNASPLIKSRAKQVEKGESSLALAKKNYYPDFTFGASYGYSGGLPEMWQYRVDLKVPLYFWEKQRQGVLESAHALDQAKQEKEAAAQTVNETLQDVYSRAQASEKLLELYAARIVPDSALTYESSLAGYESGKLDFLTVLTNLVTKLNYDLASIEELMKFEQARAQIDEITGNLNDE